MTEHLRIEHAGTELWLLADKALYWPEQRALLIADIHFGKAAAYRRLGQPVPHGTTAANLQRLDALLARYPAREIIFLGDFLHAPESRSEATLAALRQWRHVRPELRLTLVRGNHDQRAGDPPGDLAVEVVDEPLLRGPFALQHEPHPHPTHAVLAGHLHPAFCLQGKGRQRLRLPCFSIEARVSLLPAFGEFTGAVEIDPAPGRRLFVVGGDGVWAVATARTPG